VGFFAKQRHLDLAMTGGGDLEGHTGEHRNDRIDHLIRQSRDLHDGDRQAFHRETE
jgi:hypothetical protein